jgi:hypothetical protein
MPQRVTLPETVHTSKGCLIASVLFFLGIIAVLVYAAVKIA